MNILYITPYTPTRVRVRPYNLLRTLVEHGHKVVLATVWTTDEEKQGLPELESLGIAVTARPLPLWRSPMNALFAITHALPLQATFSWQPDLARAVANTLHNTNIDVVHVEHLRGARYGLYAQSQLRRFDRSPPVIWDSVDCISYLFAQAARYSRSRKARLMAQLELKRTQHFEGWLVNQFDQTLVTSHTDQIMLEELSQKAPHFLLRNGQPSEACTRFGQLGHSTVQLVANGVDLAYFTPDDSTRHQARLVFTGKMSYHANVTAAIHLIKDIMPLVWANRPDVEVWLVGKDPPAEVLALASPPTDRIDCHRDHPGQVVVTGTVPDLRPYLRQATLAVAPIPYGAGIQNKVLESMACGTPVVVSCQAATAIHAQPEREFLVAKDANTFAETILHLLESPDRRAQIGSAGRAFVERCHSWHTAVEQLEKIYQTMIDVKSV